MPNLKDIRIRINSVKTTRQVTSAMKMVSAAKFKKAQDDISHIRPYVERLAGIIFDLTQSLDDKVELEWSKEREPNKILLVVVSSNRGLCGAFNSNVIKEAERLLKTKFKYQFKQGNVDIMAIGKQAQKILNLHGYPVSKEFNELYNEMSYQKVKEISTEVMDAYKSEKYDRVILIYNEFKNAAVQELRADQFLPMQLPTGDDFGNNSVDYIVEPNKLEFIEKVIPEALQTMFYRVILESLASEHGSRMTSMHKATDNATEMLSDLQLSYNKARQGAITTEILEIVGGAEALKK
ncbi:ATP synthase F1 subunit gamma [Carboxylicivirga sp. N1Y90]|uniref:ATP synthase F1 subunit gamma n=1 Tax=Carboxylicivirga fragile TaxID=3417571 RepID=UPI003D354318|nr:ATP synthase F1 subunit gamma [Marinilabiliaceae bacterium N1Y90]